MSGIFEEIRANDLEKLKEISSGNFGTAFLMKWVFEFYLFEFIYLNFIYLIIYFLSL